MVVTVPAVVVSPMVNRWEYDRATDAPEAGTGAVVWEGVLSPLHEVVEEYEYHFRPNEQGGFSTPNRFQKLRFDLNAAGFTVRPRDEEASWNMRFELEGIGRDHDWTFPVARPSTTVKGAELHMDHGPFTVRYTNDRSGMRQDFLVQERPSGTQPLKVRMRVFGPLKPELSAPDKVQFVERRSDKGPNKTKFTYDGLVAWDSRGDTLLATMEVVNDELVITVVDSAAAYPIVIDPLSSTTGAMLEVDRPGALFGTTVSSAGDVNGDGYSDVLVGAPSFDAAVGDEGAVFLFMGSAAGLSTSAAWTWSGGQGGAQCGWACSTAGDVNADGYSDVLIGEPLWDNGQTNEGRALLFLGSASGLGPAPAWTKEGDQAEARCGHSVATAGDVNADGYSDILIGAPLYDDGQSNEGVVFLHSGSAAGVIAPPTAVLQRDQANAEFGSSVSAAGDVNRDGFSDILVGAPLYDQTQVDEGAFCVYHGSAAGISGNPPPNGTRFRSQAGAQLGRSVSFAGDVNGDGYADVVVGSPFYSGSLAQQGQALMYRGGPTGITASPAWTHNGGQAGAQAGASVAGLGDANGDGYADVVIGIPLYANGQIGEGLVRVFQGTAGLAGLSLTANWSKEGAQTGAGAGSWVAPAGDVNGDGLADLAFGAPAMDNGELDEGVVMVHHGAAGLPSTTALWGVESDQDQAMLGTCVTRAGDVNGDGFSDVLIGAPQFSNGQTREGRATLHLGAATGPSSTPAWTAESNSVGAHFGHSLASAGDVNGDGFSDIIVGAPYFTNGQYEEGRAYLYLGSATGPSTVADWTYESDQANARSGWSVASAGDVNGDGYSDVVIGAYMHSSATTADGRAYVFLGSATGLAPTPQWTYDSGQTNSFFGISVALAGDVNGDGYDDVLIGSSLYDDTYSTEGAAFLFHGSPGGLGTTPAWVAFGGQGTAQLGNQVGHAGDVNGDGYSDVFIGVYQGTDAQTGEGLVRVYHGGPGGLSATPDALIVGGQVNARFGVSASNAGDVNGDGYSDLVVGAQRFSMAFLNEGRASLFLGGPGGVPTAPAWSVTGGQAGAELGFSVSGAGDVNGDGHGDLLVGAPQYSGGNTNEGRVTLYLGNGAGGIANRTRQYRDDMVTPVQTSNGTFNASCTWTIGQFARYALGRGKMKLAWELKGHGPPFSGSPLTNSMAFSGSGGSWTDGGATGAEIKESISILALNSSHPAWRVRVRHHPATMLNGQTHGPWRYGGLHDDQVPALKVDRNICGALPLRWLGHTTNCSDGELHLQWSTASEASIARFDISHGYDGAAWTYIGSVSAKGGPSATQYQWSTQALFHEESYLRIDVVDDAGQVEESHIAAVGPCSDGSSHAPVLAPNPAHGTTCLITPPYTLAGSSITVRDIHGREVLHFFLEPNRTGTSRCFSLESLPSGIYMVGITPKDGGPGTTLRLVLE